MESGGFVSSSTVNSLLNHGGGQKQPRELEWSLDGADARAWYQTRALWRDLLERALKGQSSSLFQTTLPKIRKQNLTDFQESALCCVCGGLTDKIKLKMLVLCGRERRSVQMVMQIQCEQLYPFLCASGEQALSDCPQRSPRL